VTSSPTREWFQPALSGPSIELLPGDIFYVDMRRAKMAEIKPRLEELAKAPRRHFRSAGLPNRQSRDPGAPDRYAASVGDLAGPPNHLPRPRETRRV